MARNRTRAADRKAQKGLAHQIGSGVYTIAVDLQGRELPLPLPLTAPLIYASEMTAAVLAQKHEWARGRREDVSKYVFHALQELLVATVEGFDREHFEAYIAAAVLQDTTESG